MRAISILAVLLLAGGPAIAADEMDLACSGVFGADTSHERLVDAFGTQNVISAQVAGDEGTYPEATVLFPTDPSKRLSLVWSDRDGRITPHWIFVGEDSEWTIDGLRVGMNLAEVEALNGRPFILGGFDDIDRGQVQDWDGGTLRMTSGACRLIVSFGYPWLGTPISLDDPVSGQGSYSSSNPTFHALGAKIRSLQLYFE